MTKKTKEAIKTSAVIIIAVLAILVLWVYPLNQAGKIMDRPEEVPPPPDVSQWGLVGDTLAVVGEDNLTLRGWYFNAYANADTSTHDSLRGTVILVHGLGDGYVTQLDKAKALVSMGFNVVVYDQRTYGQSDGKYRSGGYFEAGDLAAIVARLALEIRLPRPVIIWGEQQGATAAMRVWPEESRVDYLIAENIVVNGRDWQERVVRHQDLSAPRFMLGIIWWWQKKTSGQDLDVGETDITDFYTSALEIKPDRTIMLASGESGGPAGDYIASLFGMGGKWLILSAADDGLFPAHKQEILNYIRDLTK